MSLRDPIHSSRSDCDTASDSIVLCNPASQLDVATGCYARILSGPLDQTVYFTCVEADMTVSLKFFWYEAPPTIVFAFAKSAEFFEMVRLLVEAKVHAAAVKEAYEVKMEALYKAHCSPLSPSPEAEAPFPDPAELEHDTKPATASTANVGITADVTLLDVSEEPPIKLADICEGVNTSGSPVDTPDTPSAGSTNSTVDDAIEEPFPLSCTFAFVN